MKKNSKTPLLVFAFLIGLSLLLYPTLSNYYNSFHTSRAVASYSEAVANMDEEDYSEILNAAEDFNRRILSRTNRCSLTEPEQAEYDGLLDVNGSGIMGYVEIPSIDVGLPIYHGTDETVLQIAVGHIEWSSLPVGGESSHCILSGHRGLPSAKLFTDLDEVVVGDIFTIRVLNELLTYEVDQILTVEPENVSALQVEEGQDYCTLVTCTPYGINTHRLLIRGHRIDNIDDHTVYVTVDAIQFEPLIVAPIIAIPLIIILLVWLNATDRKRKDS